MVNVYCGSSKYSVYIKDGKLSIYKYGRALLPSISIRVVREEGERCLFEGWDKEVQDLFYVKGNSKEGESIVQMSDRGVVIRLYIKNTHPMPVKGIKIEFPEYKNLKDLSLERDEVRDAVSFPNGIIGVVEDEVLSVGREKEGLEITKEMGVGETASITLVISSSKEEYDYLMSTVRGKELREVYNLVDKDFLTFYTYFFDNFDIKTSNYDLQELVNIVKNNIMLNVKKVEGKLIFLSSPFKEAVNVSKLLSSLPHLFHLNDHEIIKNTLDFISSYFDKKGVRIPYYIYIGKDGAVKEIAYEEDYDLYLLSMFLTVVNEYVERTGDIKYGEKMHKIIEKIEERIAKKIEDVRESREVSKYDFYAVLALTSYYKDRKLYKHIIDVVDEHLDYVSHSFKEEHVPDNKEELVSVLGILSLSSLSKVITHNFVKELRGMIKSEDMKRILDFFSVEDKTIEEMEVLITKTIDMLSNNPTLLLNSFAFHILINKIIELDVKEVKGSIKIRFKNIMNKGKLAIYNMNYQGISLSLIYNFTAKKVKMDYDVKDKRYGVSLEMPFESEVVVNGKREGKGKEVYLEIS